MTKVGEHVTLDIIGTEKEYEPKFFEKLVYKISKKAKVTVLEISKYKFEPQGLVVRIYTLKSLEQLPLLSLISCRLVFQRILVRTLFQYL